MTWAGGAPGAYFQYGALAPWLHVQTPLDLEGECHQN